MAKQHIEPCERRKVLSELPLSIRGILTYKCMERYRVAVEHVDVLYYEKRSRQVRARDLKSDRSETIPQWEPRRTAIHFHQHIAHNLTDHSFGLLELSVGYPTNI